MSRPGQARDGTWAAGARRTLDAGSEALWRLVVTSQGQELLGFTPGSIDPGAEGVTTFVEASHYRRRISVGDRTAILQVRVLPVSRNRTTLALHAEGLPDEASRQAILETFQDALARFSDGRPLG